MIVNQRDGSYKVTCVCGAPPCGEPDGPGVVVESFPDQDVIIVSISDGDGPDEVTVSLSELRKLLGEAA
jgi:hypothetical protein